jgi:flagellar basal body L-ring protein FlgH
MTWACSSNPFKNTSATDYNALTYGDEYDYNNGGSRGGSWSGRTPNIPEATHENPYHASDRVPAAESPSHHDSYYADEKLDPTDDSVRASIESKRGYASGGSFVHGDRATRDDFYDNAPGDGSLWSKENDANYFFTKGKNHTTGDIISVKLEDSMVKQVAEEVKKSLTPAEQEVEMALYLKNNDAAKNDQDLKAYRNVASEDLKSAEAQAVEAKMEKAVRWSQVDLSKVIGMNPNEELRAEIIDRFQNGNFKIRAVKRVLYRGSSKTISMVAVAPAADLDDKDTINSGKLYEYKVRVAR